MKKKLSVSIVGEETVDAAMASTTTTGDESTDRDAKKETSGPFESASTLEAVEETT